MFADWGPKTFEGVPFVLVDPRGDRVPNAIMLYGDSGKIPGPVPKRVSVDVPHRGQDDPFSQRRQRLGLSGDAEANRSR